MTLIIYQNHCKFGSERNILTNIFLHRIMQRIQWSVNVSLQCFALGTVIWTSRCRAQANGALNKQPNSSCSSLACQAETHSWPSALSRPRKSAPDVVPDKAGVSRITFGKRNPVPTRRGTSGTHKRFPSMQATPVRC